MVSIQIRLLPDEAARLMRAIELGADHGSLADGAVALAETVLSGSPVRTVDAGVGIARRCGLRRAGHAGCRSARRSRSLSTSRPRTWRGPPRSATDSPRKRAGDCSATPAWCRCWRTPAARPSTSGARRAPCRPPSAARFGPATRPAASPAARTAACSMRIMSATGSTAARPSSPTSFHCCRRHHRYLHEYGFSAELRDGELVFLDPDGHEIPRSSDARRSPTAPSIGCARRSSSTASRSPRRPTRRDGTAAGRLRCLRQRHRRLGPDVAPPTRPVVLSAADSPMARRGGGGDRPRRGGLGHRSVAATRRHRCRSAPPPRIRGLAGSRARGSRCGGGACAGRCGVLRRRSAATPRMLTEHRAPTSGTEGPGKWRVPAQASPPQREPLNGRVLREHADQPAHAAVPGPAACLAACLAESSASLSSSRPGR